MNISAQLNLGLFLTECVLQIFPVGMSGIKTAKQLLRKDIKRTIALMTPEEKKRQSISVTEKVSELLGKIWTVLTY
jgi:hypothetical protein